MFVLRAEIEESCREESRSNVDTDRIDRRCALRDLMAEMQGMQFERSQG
jgi:hypothetical protein